MSENILELKFREGLYSRYEKCRKYLIPKEEYFQIIEEIRNASQNKRTKTRHEYYLLNRYDVLQCGDIERLIKKRETPDETPVYYVCIEDTFDIIRRVHIATGHGGRDRMLKDIQIKYANIHRDTIELYKSLCQQCQRKRKRPMTKGVVVKPILTSEFSSRGQVDLIDMQSMARGTHKWIMVYQDHLTKFCVLRPLTSKRAAEVAFQLTDIFLLLGAPVILQSDNGSEFTAQIINELCSIWPALSIVHGKPRHPQSQGSVERANGDIKDMLVAWMADNNSTDWPMGIKFVQFSKNSAYHAGIKRSPYAAMFGINARVGHKNWTFDDWKKVLWTDESKIVLFGSNRRVYVRGRVGERLLDDCVTPTVKHGGGSIMIWGSISGNSVGDIIKIDKIMDKNVYHNILVRHGVPSGLRIIGRDFIFQEDNDPKHSSHLCRNYLKKKEDAGVLKMMVWPPQSPDLNPIEQMWELIVSRLNKSKITSKDSLWKNVQSIWRSISSETIEKYVKTMPKRCADVIAAKGGHTKY